jgi:hypothetical protein
MSYHNVRDKYGRFSKRAAARVRKIKEPVNKPTDTLLINVFLLDDSASMAGKESATIEGFNKILADARQTQHDTGLKAIDFLSKFGEPGRFTWTDHVTPLDRNKYCPQQASTAMNDATVFGINQTQAYIDTLGTDKKYKVVLTVFTDGEENSSQLYRAYAGVKSIITQKQKEGWVINLIGAGTKERVERMAGLVGIYASNSMHYTNDSKGTRSSMAKMSAALTSYTTAVASGAETTVDGFFSDEK